MFFCSVDPNERTSKRKRNQNKNSKTRVVQAGKENHKKTDYKVPETNEVKPDDEDSSTPASNGKEPETADDSKLETESTGLDENNQSHDEPCSKHKKIDRETHT